MRTVNDTVTVETLSGGGEAVYKFRAADGVLLGEAIRYGDGFMANAPWIRASMKSDCASLSEAAAWLEAVRDREEQARVGCFVTRENCA